ncbi:E3 ubiquitin ligase SCF complex, Skp subunit [Rozella allomycis CSF55]|uniref:E3 ubiquitin ligase complex SCF subunit n=1 Tax=Rozella allomycis (strain CSF55) TaxID=988480 RepID=A0A075B1P6_ROZAC|nr:E3 ubiquitin ligase complex SCF subunit sconC [Rozella allomycis CSF55]RKP22087.1 E3 ubiquitin ligase SCF complex, Skp subunit [Rozella allomycis CSF55]|eukprot:EPZ36463.1 E3 ubiquitin ligase complex SCF subunit sconC [Rozella allomycis CSF55]
MVRLCSSDNKEFVVDNDIAERSILIKNMLGDLGDSEATIPLPKVSGAILSKIIEYMTYHRNDPPASDDDTVTDITAWDSEFIKLDQGTLFEIILAANYMDIKSLLDLGCKHVADMIKGKSVEELRTLFSIENDFTPEEEERIRKENSWLE